MIKFFVLIFLFSSCNLLKMLGEKSDINADPVSESSAQSILFFGCAPAGSVDTILCSFNTETNALREHEISPGFGPYNAKNITMIDGRVYMGAEGTMAMDREPYVYDIKSDILTLMGDLNASSPSSSPAAFYKITDNKVGFVAELAVLKLCATNSGPYTISPAECSTITGGAVGNLGPIAVSAGVIYTATTIGNALGTGYGIYYCSGSNLAILAGTFTYDVSVSCDDSQLKVLKNGGLLSWDSAGPTRNILWTITGALTPTTATGFGTASLITHDISGNIIFRWFNGTHNNLYFLPMGSSTPQIIRNNHISGEIVQVPAIIQGEMIFYTNLDTSNVDQVFSFNLATNKTTQLTNFPNTNYFIRKLFLSGEYIYLFSEYISSPFLSGLFKVHVTGKDYQKQISTYVIDANQESAIFPL